jgi:pimeloyl-ACP methyl ester carboxylesterase
MRATHLQLPTLRRWRRRELIGIGLLAPLALVAGCRGEAAAPPAPVWVEAACPSHEVAPPVRCGTVPVFEDRDAAEGRRIDLQVIVLGATGDALDPDPVFVLFGGPGQGAAEFALDVAAGFERTRLHRDVVFVDQRGTGGSNPLDCELPEDPAVAFQGVFPRDLMRQCRARLEQHANLALYTTSNFADDLDDVRRALGYERINLSGGSYGTRAALVYARRHPRQVRSMVLDGAFPPTILAGLTYARTADESLRHVFADCRADTACNHAYPDAEARFDRFWRGYAEPARVVLSSRDGPTAVEVSRGVFGYGVRGMQYGSGIWHLPKALAGAEAGNLAPVAEAYLGRARSIWDAVSVGLHLSVFCAEDLPYVDPAQVPAMTDGTYLGDYLFEEYRQACELWVRGDIPADFHEPVRSDSPVLIFSGRRDPITPPWLAEEAMETLPNSLQVVFPAGGHGYSGGDGGGCKARLADEFIVAGSVAGLDTGCAAEVATEGFAR